MKVSTERKLIRWIHLVLSIPIIGFIYGPVASIPEAAFAVRWVFMPIVILAGSWLWLGPRLKARLKTCLIFRVGGKNDALNRIFRIA